MENDLSSFVDCLPGLVWTARPNGQVDFLNRHWCEYTGLTVDGSYGSGWHLAIHPHDRPNLLDHWRSIRAAGKAGSMEGRLRRFDGEYRWFHFRTTPLVEAFGEIVKWCGTGTDIDDLMRSSMGQPPSEDGHHSVTDIEALLAGEKRLLEMVTTGRQSMAQILEALCQLAESAVTGCYCSVVLVDPNRTRLEKGAGPSLPAGLTNPMIDSPVQVDTGPCAMAVFLNEQVIASDISLDTRWHAWSQMALAHGVRACWATPISSATGTILGAFAVYYDRPRTPTSRELGVIDQLRHIASITIDRAQRDAALKHSEARKAAILDAALDCIISIDAESGIIEFNPAAERTFGYRRDDVVGKQLAETIIPSSLREEHRQGLARYLSTGEGRLVGKRVEMTAIRADGSEFPVELAISHIPIDGPPSFTCYLRDITDRKQSEEALQRSGAFLAEAQHLSRTGSFSWCVATGEVVWSDQVYRIFEFDPGTRVTLELIGTRVHPEDIPMMKDMIARAEANAEDFEYEHRLLMPDRSVKYLHLVAHATRNQNGQFEYIGAVQDVTKRRLSEEALKKVSLELAHVARVASLGTLTASIAHEVNQPLSGILTNASTCLRMLAADPPNVEGARETAQRTIRDGNRASDVIKRLRALFSKRDGTTEALDLNEAASEVLALSLGDLRGNRVIVEAELASALPLVTADRVQLQQVILNLIQNASEAMSGVEDRPRRLVIRTEQGEDDHVRVIVQDSGVGFASQDADKLFDAFYTTKDNGMGIGLSVSRSIVEKHQGRLWAMPNEGPGATVAFSIPSRAADVKEINEIGVTRRCGEQAMNRM